jgi:hypothetical protein
MGFSPQKKGKHTGSPPKSVTISKIFAISFESSVILSAKPFIESLFAQSDDVPLKSNQYDHQY